MDTERTVFQKYRIICSNLKEFSEKISLKVLDMKNIK